MRTFFFLFLIIPLLSFGQSDKLSNYKYVVVKSKFDFVKDTDGYQTSSLTKFLFNKKGFEAYLDNEVLPQELAENNCNALFADIIDDSGFLRTKGTIQLKDCKNNVIYTSVQGDSKLKDYKKAYHETIREAFYSIAKLDYKYNGFKAKKTVAKKEKPVIREPKKLDKEVVSKSKPIMVSKKVEVQKKEAKPKKVNKSLKKESIPVLYAQEKNGGFQLVNTDPRVVFFLLKTKTPSKFIIKDKNGTLTKQGDYWLAEYYLNGELVEEKYQIKF